MTTMHDRRPQRADAPTGDASPGQQPANAYPAPLPGRRSWSRAWQETAADKYTRLVQDVVYLSEHDAWDECDAFVQHEVLKPLACARNVLARPTRPGQQWPPQMWTGAAVEDTWRLLHQAEDAIVTGMGEEELRARVPSVLAGVKRDLGTKHSAVRNLAAQVSKTGADSKGMLRAAAVAALRAKHAKTDAVHRAARSFRNQLLTVSAILLAAAVALLVTQSQFGFRLLSQPQGTDLSATETLTLGMLFGCFGALFSTVPSLATQPRSGSPFSIALSQAALKVTTGAWSAVIGLLAISSSLVPNPTADDAAISAAAEVSENPEAIVVLGSVAAMVMLAALFGAGQEALTRFVDRKARGILEESSETPTTPQTE